MVNVNKLKGKFIEMGYSAADISKGTGIKLSTLYRRLSKSNEFTIGEAEAIVRFLNLDANEATSIFFNHLIA